MNKKRVYAYYDGSNFYHLSKINYGITKIMFGVLTKQLLTKDEELIKIKYFNSPINQQEDPENYAKQLKFFEKLKKTEDFELYLGRLVKRPLNKINIRCVKCGLQKAEDLNCPKCGKKINIKDTFKTTERGVDVQIAINLLLDALNNKYDTALLFSGDADFVPAVGYIIKNLKKEIVFCNFPKPRTNELLQGCSESRLITKKMMENSKIIEK